MHSTCHLRLKLLSAILIVMFTVAGLAATASAKPPEGVTIDVEVGYNGFLQMASINPVIVTLDNASTATNLSGDIALVCNGIEYVSRLELPAPSRKRLFFYFPCDSWPPALQLNIRTRAYSEVFDLNRVYKPMKPGDLSVVVLTRQTGSMGVINQALIANLDRDLYRSHTASVDSGNVYVSYYNIDEIDFNPKFFARAQTVIVGDIDYEQVEGDLAETLKAAAAGGANVVFSLGVHGLGLKSSPLSDLCPINVSETALLSDLGAFGRSYGIDASQTPAVFATGGLKPGAAVDAWAGSTPAVASMNYGAGHLSALAFDYAAVPFKQNPALGRLLIDTTMRVGDTSGVRDAFMHPEYVSQVLRGLTEAKPITPMFVLLFLLLYIALVGPANFLILRRMKRRTLVWATIPIIIVAFAWFGLNTGYITRGSDNVVAAFQELHIYPDSDYTPYQNLMLVFTAKRTNYTLEVPDRSAFLFADVPTVLDSYQFTNRGPQTLSGISGGQVDNSANPTVKTTQGQWTSKEFLYQGNLALGAEVDSDLSAVHGEKSLSSINGSFSLNLPFNLDSCYLFAPFFTQQLGHIEGQGTYTLPMADTQPNTVNWAGNYLAENLPLFASQQKEAATNALLYRNEMLLVGFTDEVEALADFKRAHKNHQLTMVVVHLPYTPVLPNQGQPQVSRTVLVGGLDFERYEQPSYYYTGRRDSSLFKIEKDGYIDVSYELVGSMGSRNNLLIYLEGQEPENFEAIKDFSAYVTVQVERSGVWYERQMNDDEGSLFLDIGGAIQDDGHVVVRFKARQDCLLAIPEADYSSTS